MRKEDCAFHDYWDPTPKDNFSHYDWNHTLVKVINVIALKIQKETHIPPNKIILHPINRDLFKDISYYNDDTQILFGRYGVVFNDECEHNIIYVYNDKIENPNHVYMKITRNDPDLIEVTPTFDPNDIEEIKKTHCGYIEIKKIFKFFK